jgi:hypothetical protein
MKILALEKERPGAHCGRILLRPSASAWDSHPAGAIREIHFRDDRSQAVVILEAESPCMQGNLHATASRRGLMLTSR